jgi:biopolymer transport protein ExbD
VTGRINIDQSVARPDKKQENKEPPKRLTVMIDKTGYVVKWADERPEPIPLLGPGKYNAAGLKAKMKDLLQEKVKTDQRIMVAPIDEARYDEMISVMDTCMTLGLNNLMVADAASVAAEMQ